MGNKEEGQRWFGQAREDLKTAMDLLKSGHFDAASFYSQQAAEKALKGYIYSKGYRALQTHSVLELIEKAEKLEKAFAQYIKEGQELDRHYIGSRYPNFYPSGPPYKYYNKELAEKCLNHAGLILKEVERFIPK